MVAAPRNAPTKDLMTRTRMLLPAAAMTLTLGLGACGGSDEDDVKKIATQVANSDEKACDNITGDFLKAVGGTKAKCRQSAKQDTSKKKPKVGATKINGKKGTVVLTDGKTKATLQFAKQGDDWKLSGVK